MGVINQGILGAVSGKVGPVVGGKWKGIPYLRSYVVPKYTNTDDQKAQRGAFGACAGLARNIKLSIVQPLWDRLVTNMSGFNYFIKKNIGYFTSPGFWVTEAIKIALGDLQGIDGLAAEYDNTTGEIDLTWEDNTGVNGALATDNLFIVVTDKYGNALYSNMLSDAQSQRSLETKTITTVPGQSLNDIFVFAGFHRGTGVDMKNSDSFGVKATIAA
jgi:hypothetical protein